MSLCVVKSESGISSNGYSDSFSCSGRLTNLTLLPRMNAEFRLNLETKILMNAQERTASQLLVSRRSIWFPSKTEELPRLEGYVLERLSVDHSHAVSVSAPNELFENDGNAADGMVIGTRNHYFAISILAKANNRQRHLPKRNDSAHWSICTLRMTMPSLMVDRRLHVTKDEVSSERRRRTTPSREVSSGF